MRAAALLRSASPLFATAAQRRSLTVMLIVLACLAPLALQSYGRFVLTLVMINIVAVIGINISMGFCGLVSVGHAGFMAIGAYVSALLMNKVGLGVLPSLAGGTIVSAIAGVVIGLPALRLNSLYIAMVTYGFGQAVGLVALNWIDVTGGPNGMTVLVPPVLGYDLSSAAIYVIAAAAAVGALLVERNIVQSRLGRAFVSIRDSEIAAQAMGVRLARYKTLAFALSAAFGGLAGALYALTSAYVNPDAFTFSTSILLVTMCAAGGIGTLWGPVVGALILTLLPELLRPFAEFKEFFSGIILLAVLVLMPHGITPLFGRLRKWIGRAKFNARTTPQ